MRIVTETTLASVLGSLAATPRVVVSGNFATPWQALEVLDKSVEQENLDACLALRTVRHPCRLSRGH
jgi:hypothetical protein